MKKKWQLVIITLLTLAMFSGCVQNENSSSNTEENNYGFFNTSYENWLVEGVKSHDKIALNPYGESDKEVKLVYDMILKYMKEASLTEDDDLTIFNLSKEDESEKYLVIKNMMEEGNYYSMVYVLVAKASDSGFEIVNSEKLDGQINDAKTALYTVEDHILISSEAPASAYIDNYYLKWSKGLMFLKRESFDIMEIYLEKKIDLFEKEHIEEAMALENLHLYPFTYETLINKSNNLALKKLYPLAKDLNAQEKWEEARSYLEIEVPAYIDRAVMGAESIEVYIDSEVGQPYSLTKKEVVETVELYYNLLIKTGYDEDAEWIKSYLDVLNTSH
jgi:hypothetical protein